MNTVNAAANPAEPFKFQPWLNAAAAPAVPMTVLIDTTGAQTVLPLTWLATKTFGTATGPLPVIWS